MMLPIIAARKVVKKSNSPFAMRTPEKKGRYNSMLTYHPRNFGPTQVPVTHRTDRRNEVLETKNRSVPFVFYATVHGTD